MSFGSKAIIVSLNRYVLGTNGQVIYRLYQVNACSTVLQSYTINLGSKLVGLSLSLYSKKKLDGHWVNGNQNKLVVKVVIKYPPKEVATIVNETIKYYLHITYVLHLY